MRKEKIVRYGSIYTNWSFQNAIDNAIRNTNTINVHNTKDNTKDNAPKPKINLTEQHNRQRILKDIHSKFVANTTDHEILCIIKPYMYSKTLPRMDIESTHRMVLDRIRKGDMKTVEECLASDLNSTSYNVHTGSKHSLCHVCSQSGMVYNTFCIKYRTYHEHVPLCIGCGGNIEAKGSVLFDKVGKRGYDNFIKKICCAKRHLPQDIILIIMQYVYKLLDGVCIRY